VSAGFTNVTRDPRRIDSVESKAIRVCSVIDSNLAHNAQGGGTAARGRGRYISVESQHAQIGPSRDPETSELAVPVPVGPETVNVRSLRSVIKEKRRE
jgi:hypothetical protein